jgi:hypothetical protein
MVHDFLPEVFGDSKVPFAKGTLESPKTSGRKS